MEQKMEPTPTEIWGIVDLIGAGLYTSEQTIRDHIRRRRLPRPMKVCGKLRWYRKDIERWFRDGTICWVPRNNGGS
jgi:hypothetical protein